MANIVRCELPDGVHRFSPFTVSDYRDFLLVRNDMNTKSPEDQENLLKNSKTTTSVTSQKNTGRLYS